MINKEGIRDFLSDVSHLLLFFLALHIPLRLFELVANELSILIIVIHSIISIMLAFLSYQKPKTGLGLIAVSSVPLLVYFYLNINYDLSSNLEIVIGSIYIIVFVIVICFKHYDEFVVDNQVNLTLNLRESHKKNQSKKKSNWRKVSRRARVKSLLQTQIKSGKYRG